MPFAVARSTIDCVPAADYRYIEAILANADGSPAWKPSLDAVLARYTALTGFDPTTGQPDLGTDTAADLAAWCRDGIHLTAIQRDIVPAWAAVDHLREDEIDLALSLAPCLVSLNLPAGWEAVEDYPDAWREAPGPATGEFHRVLLGAPLTLRSWGRHIVVGEKWWEQCVVAVDFLGVRDVLAVDAVDWDGFARDMQGLV